MESFLTLAQSNVEVTHTQRVREHACSSNAVGGSFLYNMFVLLPVGTVSGPGWDESLHEHRGATNEAPAVGPNHRFYTTCCSYSQSVWRRKSDW